MDTPQHVVVRWYDAVVFPGWVHHDPELHVPRSITSVGFLVKDTESFLCLATSFDRNQGEVEHWGNLTIIPRSAVESYIVIPGD